MFIAKFAKVATVVAVVLVAGSVPTLAHDKKPAVTTRVAPVPALGTGLPGLIVLAAGLAAAARRRRG
jgi:hypothetical protein